MKYLIGFLLLLIVAGGWYYVMYQNQGFTVVIDSPALGQSVRIGDESFVSWSTFRPSKIGSVAKNNTSMRFSIVPESFVPADAFGVAPIQPFVNDLPFTTTGSVNFTVPNIEPGQYKIRMQLYGSGNKISNNLWGLEYYSQPFTLK